MKNFLFLALIVPGITFAGGYGVSSTTTSKKAVTTQAESVVTTPVTTTTTPSVRTTTRYTAPTRRTYTPAYESTTTGTYNPYWWMSRTPKTEVLNRTTTGTKILNQKQRRAQSKLMKYRSMYR